MADVDGLAVIKSLEAATAMNHLTPVKRSVHATLVAGVRGKSAKDSSANGAEERRARAVVSIALQC